MGGWYIVFMLSYDMSNNECDYSCTLYIICYIIIHGHRTVFCGHSFTRMYKISVTVIVKPMGLGGTIYTCD